MPKRGHRPQASNIVTDDDVRPLVVRPLVQTDRMHNPDDIVVDEAAIAEMKRKTPEVVADCFALIEAEMFKGPWVMGETYTICDPYLFTLAQWLEADGVDTARLPRVIDHRTRMSQRPGVRSAIAAELG